MGSRKFLGISWKEEDIVSWTPTRDADSSWVKRWGRSRIVILMDVKEVSNVTYEAQVTIPNPTNQEFVYSGGRPISEHIRLFEATYHTLSDAQDGLEAWWMKNVVNGDGLKEFLELAHELISDMLTEMSGDGEHWKGEPNG